MRRIYTVLAYLAVPIVFTTVLFRAVRDRAYREGWRQRFGFGAVSPQRTLWIHAVSMGEVAAAGPLVLALRRSFPEFELVVTSTTPAGVQRARSLFGDVAQVRFAPYDLPGAVRRAVENLRPHLAVFLETEIWPNLYHELQRRGVPRVIVNARISDRSWPRYRRWRGLFGPALESTTVLAQSSKDIERFEAMGASPGLMRIAGNLKFDVELAERTMRPDSVRAEQFASRVCWAAGSTHRGEEPLLIAAHQKIRSVIPSALLLLAPRHAARFDEVAQLLERERITYQRRSERKALDPRIEVLLVDTLGELVDFYAMASAAFVGGSLVPLGGHNLLEPCALGVPVATGPSNENAADVFQVLLERGAVQCVRDAEQISRVMQAWLGDPQAAQAQARRALEVIEANRGALAVSLAVIEKLVRGSARRV